MAISLHLQCTDDQTEWSFDLTPAKEWELQLHSLFLKNEHDPRGAEMVEMRCSACHKNHGHTVTRVFSADPP